MKTLRLYKGANGLLKVKTQKTGQWYLMFCSRNGSPTPLNNIVLLLEVRIKSMREEEFSVKCVGSLIICSKLNCWHRSLTFQLELSFRISRLKSPVIKILEMLVSKASPVESSIDDKIAFVELGGL